MCTDIHWITRRANPFVTPLEHMQSCSSLHLFVPNISLCACLFLHPVISYDTYMNDNLLVSNVLTRVRPESQHEIGREGGKEGRGVDGSDATSECDMSVLVYQ